MFILPERAQAGLLVNDFVVAGRRNRPELLGCQCQQAERR